MDDCNLLRANLKFDLQEMWAVDSKRVQHPR